MPSFRRISRRLNTAPKDEENQSKINTIEWHTEQYVEVAAQYYGDPHDAEKQFDWLIRTYHYCANIYPWDWDCFYYRTPISVIKGCMDYLAYKAGRGYMSHAEVAFAKVQARKAGTKFE